MDTLKSWYDEKLPYLVDKDGIKKYLPNKKKDKYTMSVPLTNLEQKQREGWTLVKAKKTTAQIEKKKIEFERFQDLVWVMLAEMGFSYLTEDANKFRLPREDDKEKQIDVFGIDNEGIVVLAECKAAGQGPSKRADFDDAITDITRYKGRATQFLNQHFNGTKPKYIFLFCTSNYIVGESDRSRMEKEGIVWMDASRIKYYRDLTSQLGVLAKYQFLGEILEGKSIPSLKNYKVPAIRAKMGDQICYSMMLPPSILLKLGFVLHRTDDFSRKGSYQRYVKKQRLISVNEYITAGNFFPNSIIVNIDREIDFQPGPATIPSSDNVKVGTVTLPDQYKSAFIIDGQHRLYGYAGTEQKDTDVIPVIAFIKLPPEKQTNMFVDINTKAKAVKRNLIESLNGELYWNSKNPKYALSALNSMLALELNDKNDSPLFNMIEIGDSSAKNKEKKGITLTYFIDNAIKIEKFFVIDFAKNGSPCSFGPLYDGDLADASLEKAYTVISFFYNSVKKRCEKQWDILANNIGISTLSWMLSEFLLEKRKANPDIYNRCSAREIIRIISDRIDLFCEELAKKNPEEVQTYIQGKLGYGGVDKARRHFERFMHEADPSFTQKDLEKWIIEQSGLYTDKTKQILEGLSNKIISFVQTKLISAYGTDYYLNSKIPEKVSSRIFERKRKNQNLSVLVELTDIRDIILNSWTENEFNKVFADPQVKGPKEEKTEWLNNLVEIQGKINKEEKLALADFQTVQSISEWLNFEPEAE